LAQSQETLRSGGDFAQRDFGDLVIMMSKFGSKSGDFAQRGK